MSDDPTDLRPEIARRMAADPLLSQPPKYYHPTWPGYLQEVQGMPVPTREQFLEATKDVDGLKRADRLAVWRGLPTWRGGPKRRAMPHEIAAACRSAGLDEAAAPRLTAAVMAACPPQPRWIVSNETATDDWRTEYEGLRDRAGDMAADEQKSPGQRKMAKRLEKLVVQYLTFGTPPEGMATLWLVNSAARKRFDAMDAVGREMQRLAVRLGLAAVGQPLYVSTGSVMAEDFKRRMDRQQQIVTELAAEERARHTTSKGAGKKKRRRRKRQTPDKVRPLTPRQVEVMQIVGECKGNLSQAARRMGLDRKTVEQHWDAASKKLGKQAMKVYTGHLPKDRRGQESIAGQDDGPGAIGPDTKVMRDRRKD